MRTCLRLICLAALVAACGQTELRGPVAATETRLYTRNPLTARREFEEAIVGHELRGDGVDVTVAPGGQLVGTHLGQPFVGSWEYRRQLFCISMTSPDVRRAADRSCFHAAVSGREVILVPIAEF